VKGIEMKTYHKIQTIFKRDPETNYKTLLEGEYSLPILTYLKNNNWKYTEKINGMNIRVMYHPEGANPVFIVTFAGKTDNAQLPVQLYEYLNMTFRSQIEIFKELFTSEVCLYGEGYGAGIQKGGGNYQEEKRFVLFDIKAGNRWLSRKEVEAAAMRFGIDVVPIIGGGTLLDCVKIAKSGYSSMWGNFHAEGIVARPEVELFDCYGNRVITKIKYKDWQQNRKELK